MTRVRPKKRPDPGEADVEITLNGETRKLKPSLDACMRISRLHGGSSNVVEHLVVGDFDTLCEVIALGLGVNNDRDLKQSVYKSGVMQLRAPAIRFVTIVNNGGQLPPDENDLEDLDEDEEDDSEKK